MYFAAMLVICARSAAAFSTALPPALSRIAGTTGPSASRARPALVRTPRASKAGSVQTTAVLSQLKPSSPAPGADEWGKRVAAVASPERPQLPRLTDAELAQLARGERVQRQTRQDRVGQGLVVLDVQADIATVISVLSDVERYPARIDTVRAARVVPGSKSATRCRAEFTLSRFLLKVSVELTLRRDANLLEFALDNAALQFPPPPFDEARGFWFVEPCAARGAGWSRVWLSSRVVCSPLLPPFVVDYAAARALPRATTWLRPVMENMAQGLPPICKQPGVFASEEASAQRRPVR